MKNAMQTPEGKKKQQIKTNQKFGQWQEKKYVYLRMYIEVLIQLMDELYVHFVVEWELLLCNTDVFIVMDLNLFGWTSRPSLGD